MPIVEPAVPSTSGYIPPNKRLPKSSSVPPSTSSSSPLSSISTSGSSNLQRKRTSTSSSISVSDYILSWEISKRGQETEQLRLATDVCFLERDRVAIVEQKNARVQIFNRKGKSLFRVLSEEDPTVTYPICCDTNDKKDTIFVSQLNQVLLLDVASSQFLNTLYINGRSEINGIATDRNDNLILTNIGIRPEVMIYDIKSQKIRTSLNLRKNGHFSRPSYVHVCKVTGSIYVSDTGKHCVRVFDNTGRHISNIGRRELVWPLGLTTTKEGDLLVADRVNHRICVYSDGRFRKTLLTSEDGISDPMGIAISHNSTLAVVSHTLLYKGNKYSLQVFRPLENSNL